MRTSGPEENDDDLTFYKNLYYSDNSLHLWFELLYILPLTTNFFFNSINYTQTYTVSLSINMIFFFLTTFAMKVMGFFFYYICYQGNGRPQL